MKLGGRMRTGGVGWEDGIRWSWVGGWDQVELGGRMRTGGVGWEDENRWSWVGG